MSDLRIPNRQISIVLPAFMLAACSELNEASYSRLEVGMPFEEVRGILGEPEGCDDAMGLRSCRRGDERRWVRVAFVAGRLGVTAA